MPASPTRHGLRLSIACLATVLATSSLQGRETVGTTHWEPRAAHQALAQVDREAAVRDLLSLTIAGSEAELFDQLETLRANRDWPAPARDAVAWSYTQALRELPSGSVSPDLLEWLKTWKPAALIPHEDHGEGWVPQFNVRAAAAGVEHDWLRQEALLEGLALVGSHPRALADAYLIETEAPVRAGYLQALDQAAPTEIAGVKVVALARLRGEPDLAPLAARAAALSRDVTAMRRIVDLGDGPAVLHMLRHAAATLGSTDRIALLRSTLLSPNREGAALAMAELYEGLAGLPAADAALLARLGDPDLGAAAALALAGSPALDTRLALEALAAGVDGPRTRRARLALDLQAEAMVGDGP